MESPVLENIRQLYKKYSGCLPESVQELPPSGSYRKYFRISNQGKRLIGVYNQDARENAAFLGFTQIFIKHHLNVPSIYAVDHTTNTYLIEDLGDITLLSYLNQLDDEGNIKDSTLAIYKKVIDQLPLFQIKAGKYIDYTLCYPRDAFDRQSMMWDLNYFKYYFLKLAKVPFDEQLLENDFVQLCDFLLKADTSYFLYRDFQSRNIMLVDGNPYFIDYQGGRRGALQYDIASLLFEAKTALPSALRDELFQYYLSVLSNHLTIDINAFSDLYYGFVYIRLMQAMGAYGFRGLYEKKELFLESIPKALDHLSWLLNHVTLVIKLPELMKVFNFLASSVYIRELAAKSISLTVSINSFSFKRGIPIDESQHGGGFVFDCRALRNPGRLDEYKTVNGNDPKVADFFKDDQEVKDFLQSIYHLIDYSVEQYGSKGFKNLMINFGCTGGQHRSVYSAEKLSQHLKEKYKNILIHTRHRELEMK